MVRSRRCGAAARGSRMRASFASSVVMGVDDTTLSHYRERARQDARDHLQALVDRHSLLPDEFTLSLTEGDAPMHILMMASECHCDLIVMGKHGRQAAEELLLGSVTKHVLAEAEVDVLVSTHHAV